MPERVLEVHTILAEAFWTEAGIRVHQGKTQVWNLTGENPLGCDDLERAAVLTQQPSSGGVRTSCFRTGGIKVLGTSLGHPDFVRAHLDKLTP